MYSYKQYEEGKHYQEWENFFTPFPSSINCQVYMYLYVLTCLILPLLGCIICYICIIQQIAVIKKDREVSSNLTNYLPYGPLGLLNGRVVHISANNHSLLCTISFTHGSLILLCIYNRKINTKKR